MPSCVIINFMLSGRNDIYLIRHGHPAIPYGHRFCLGGGTDLPLNTLGKMQAFLLGRELHFDRCWSSCLQRASETASFVADEVIQNPKLGEVGTGDWEGLDFEEIMQRWPAEYAARENDRSYPIPGSENLDEARARFASVVDSLPSGSAVAAHDWVIRLYTGYDKKIPHCGYIYGGEVHQSAVPAMTPALCRELRNAAGMLPHIQQHCDAVARTALEICDERGRNGVLLDRNLLECSCLMHDIARLERPHEDIGGKYISAIGWEDAGNIIRQHAEPDSDEINEAAVLSTADKITRETERVSIEQRFARFQSEEEKQKLLSVHERRLSQALRIRDEINRICGREFIQ